MKRRYKAMIGFLIVIAILGCCLMIMGAINYTRSVVVNYSFVVPQKYNATHFTLGIFNRGGGLQAYTAFPYTYKNWDWQGTILRFDVSYYIYHPKVVVSVNSSSGLVQIIPESWELVGHEIYSYEAVGEGS